MADIVTHTMITAVINKFEGKKPNHAAHGPVKL